MELDATLCHVRGRGEGCREITNLGSSMGPSMGLGTRVKVDQKERRSRTGEEVRTDAGTRSGSDA